MSTFFYIEPDKTCRATAALCGRLRAQSPVRAHASAQLALEQRVTTRDALRDQVAAFNDTDTVGYQKQLQGELSQAEAAVTCATARRDKARKAAELAVAVTHCALLGLAGLEDIPAAADAETDPGVQLALRIAEELAAARIENRGVHNLEFMGYMLKYSTAREAWYIEYRDIHLETPCELRDWLEAAHGRISLVRIWKGRGVVDHTAAIQGKYVGEGKFIGCTGSVDNTVDDHMAIQMIGVEGPPETCGDYYRGIRTREIRPTIPLEPVAPVVTLPAGFDLDGDGDI